MKFIKNQKLSLRAPQAKRAEHFIPTPKNVGGFALVRKEYIYRSKHFFPGDLVRISFNQRYIQDANQIQVISIADTISQEKRYMGNHYIFQKSALKNIKQIPPDTTIRLMSKEYALPANTKLLVKTHKKKMVTVECDKKNILIKDEHIEGVASKELDSLDYSPEYRNYDIDIPQAFSRETGIRGRHVQPIQESVFREMIPTRRPISEDEPRQNRF